MNRLRELEIRNHELARQLQMLLDSSFSDLGAGFKVSYFIGIDNEKIKYLCFSIDTKYLGNIYFKNKILRPYQTPSDIEEDFINGIMEDLLIAGCTFLYTEKGKIESALKGKWSPLRKIEISLN